MARTLKTGQPVIYQIGPGQEFQIEARPDGTLWIISNYINTRLNAERDPVFGHLIVSIETRNPRDEV